MTDADLILTLREWAEHFHGDLLRRAADALEERGAQLAIARRANGYDQETLGKALQDRDDWHRRALAAEQERDRLREALAKMLTLAEAHEFPGWRIGETEQVTDAIISARAVLDPKP